MRVEDSLGGQQVFAMETSFFDTMKGDDEKLAKPYSLLWRIEPGCARAWGVTAGGSW
jgi:hypothetical protein